MEFAPEFAGIHPGYHPDDLTFGLLLYDVTRCEIRAGIMVLEPFTHLFFVEVWFSEQSAY
jgi:hypothetical protein